MAKYNFKENGLERHLSSATRVYPEGSEFHIVGEGTRAGSTKEGSLRLFSATGSEEELIDSRLGGSEAYIGLKGLIGGLAIVRSDFQRFGPFQEREIGLFVPRPGEELTIFDGFDRGPIFTGITVISASVGTPYGTAVQEV